MEQFLTAKDVMKTWQIEKETLNRWIEGKLFPKPLTPKGKRRRWKPDVVQEWIAERESQIAMEERQLQIAHPPPLVTGSREHKEQKRKIKEFEARQQQASERLDAHRRKRPLNKHNHGQTD